MSIPQVIGVIIISAVILIAAQLKQKAMRRAEEEEQARLFDSARLQGEIDALHRASQELAELDSMIIDLRLCKPDELHKAFRINWQGSTGKEHSLDFMSTGGNTNTAHMIELAEDQRAQINADIQARIADLYARAQECCFFDSYSRKKRERSYQNGEQYDLETDSAGE